ncbi:MAG: Swt1 family HEPN domain-containing protein [Muribaculaceae bacterium]|nr:Swt1 family HEPN domain-containing protein [Muribaculaceae bacterium]
MNDDLYSFVMRGELTKSALDKTQIVSKHSSSDVLSQEYIPSLALDILDDENVNSAKLMATVYTAIAAFENTVRQFVVKVLLEHKGENWWQDCVSDKIRRTAESRKKEEEKVHWHTPRGDSMINYTEFGDLASIMGQNFDLFEVHIVSLEWARQIFSTIERSRNVIMHSGELGKRDIKRIGTNIRD